MSDEVESGKASVPVQYHQFDISDEDGPTGPDLERGHNGLARVADGVTIVRTGIHTGDVDAAVTFHATEPAPDTGDWEEIRTTWTRNSPPCLSTVPATTAYAFTPRPGHRHRPDPGPDHRVVPDPGLARPSPGRTGAPPGRQLWGICARTLTITHHLARPRRPEDRQGPGRRPNSPSLPDVTAHSGPIGGTILPACARYSTCASPSHGLTVIETALACLTDARRHGDLCRSLDWTTEVHHPVGSKEAVIRRRCRPVRPGGAAPRGRRASRQRWCRTAPLRPAVPQGRGRPGSPGPAGARARGQGGQQPPTTAEATNSMTAHAAGVWPGGVVQVRGLSTRSTVVRLVSGVTERLDSNEPADTGEGEALLERTGPTSRRPKNRGPAHPTGHRGRLRRHPPRPAWDRPP